MKEVIIIKTEDGEPIGEPDSLSWRYAFILRRYKRTEMEIKKDRGDIGILLEKLFELKRKLRCLEQALNGKHSIIVVVDSTGNEQKPMSEKSIIETEGF